MFGPSMELYILRINGDEQYPPCPNCSNDMSYLASPGSIFLRCNSCNHCITDDEADAYLKQIYAGKKVERKAVSWEKYTALTDHYPRDSADDAQDLKDIDKIQLLLLVGPDGELFNISSEIERVDNVYTFTVTDYDTGETWRHTIKTEKVKQ